MPDSCTLLSAVKGNPPRGRAAAPSLLSSVGVALLAGGTAGGGVAMRARDAVVEVFGVGSI